MNTVFQRAPTRLRLDWSVADRSRTFRCGDTTITYGVIANSDYPGGCFAEIINLETLPYRLGMGSARRAMQAFIREADKSGITLRLAASPSTDQTSGPRLRRFYRSLGFVPTGETIEVEGGDPFMIRRPKPS